MTPRTFTNTDDVKRTLGDRTSPVVVVPVFNGYQDAVRCIESLVRETPAEADVLIVDDAGADSRLLDLLAAFSGASGPRVSILRQSVNGGFVASCNAAFLAAGDRDVIVVNSDVVVGPEWYSRLTEAAQSSNVIATASALTNHGTILSVPVRNAPSPRVPRDAAPDDIAVRVSRASLRLRPTIPTAVGHCMYIKRSALNRVGGFDTAFGKGYGEEVDFSQRAVQAGFRHVCADDVFVYHRGGGSFGSDRIELQRRNEEILAARYPYYPTAARVASEDVTSSLAHVLHRATIAINGLTVAIDGSCLGPEYMGTQHVVVETVRALARTSAIRTLRVYIPPSIRAETLQKISDLDGVEILRLDQSPVTQADIAYRPFQLNSRGELNRLRFWGRWTVVNQLDAIAYHNPAYSISVEHWLRYRELTRLALHVADGVVFTSDHARREVNSEGLVSSRAAQRTIPDGADFTTPVRTSRPSSALGSSPFLLVLGAAYLHKSRSFALAVFAGLLERGWDGQLVLAGPTPLEGNSHGEEAALLLKRPMLRGRVVTLGSVSDPEKRWLFEHASALLYPSVVEGFGLVPFEAAHYGVPTVCSRGGSLDEVLPADLPTIHDFSVDDAVSLSWRVLNDGACARQMVDVVRQRAERYTWDAAAESLVDLFGEVTARRPSVELAVIGERYNLVELDEGAAGRRGAGRSIALIGMLRSILEPIIVPTGSRRRHVVRKAIHRMRRIRAGFIE